MRKLSIFVCTMLLMFSITSIVSATAVFEKGVTQNTGWADANGTSDQLMCWAASAANALYATGWNGGFASEDTILNYFKAHWSDGTGNALTATRWFFAATLPANYQMSGTTVNTSAGFAYYNDALWLAHDGSWSNPAYANVKTWIDRSNTPSDPLYGGIYGIMAHEILNGIDHYINIWGYDTDGVSVWITDNNTAFYGLEKMTFASLNIDEMDRLSENLGNVPPNQPPSGVPEPTTMLLLGSGLLGLLGFRKKIKK